MAEIRIVVHEELDVTETIVIGELSVADVLGQIDSFYSGPVTRHVLWDISQASFTSADMDDFRRIAAAVAQVSRRRAGGKSAVVAASDLSFGLSRMYQAYRETHNIESSYMSFRTRETALAWLQADKQAL
jgi:hypothetical protein